MPEDRERPEADAEEVTESPEETTDQPEAGTENDDTIDWEAAAKAARKDAEKKRKRLEEAEAKLREREEQERKAAEKKRKDEGKIEELLAEKERDLAAALEKADRYDALQEKTRQQALGRLPKNLREKYDDADRYPAEILIELVEDLAGAQRPPAGSPGTDTPNPKKSVPESWGTLTPQQQAEFLRDSPEEARKLMREYGRAHAPRR